MKLFYIKYKYLIIIIKNVQPKALQRLLNQLDWLVLFKSQNIDLQEVCLSKSYQMRKMRFTRTKVKLSLLKVLEQTILYILLESQILTLW